MRDIVLFIAVIAYMAVCWFAVSKIGKLFDDNYKGFRYDDEENEKNNGTKRKK